MAQRKEMASGFSKGPSLGLLPDVPSLMETLSYSYCYVGIMTGERARPAGLPPQRLTLCLHPLPGVWCLFMFPRSIPASAALRVSIYDRVRVRLSRLVPGPLQSRDRLFSASVMPYNFGGANRR